MNCTVKTSKDEKTWIKVFVTSTKEFRAVIKPEKGFSSEITVGGIRWKAGEFEPFHGHILSLCRDLLYHLSENIYRSEKQWNGRINPDYVKTEIEEFGLECYKQGFSDRHGSEVKNWKASPSSRIQSLIGKFYRKVTK